MNHLLQELKHIVKKLIEDKKSSVKAIHKFRVDCRKILSLTSPKDTFHIKLKKIIKLSNNIRDMDVFFQSYLLSLPEKYRLKLDSTSLRELANIQREQELTALYSYLESFKIPKQIEFYYKEVQHLSYKKQNLDIHNQKKVHKYRKYIKKRVYQELNKKQINKKKVSILQDIKSILGKINDNFNALERIKSYDVEERLFQQISKYTQEENLKLYKKFKQLEESSLEEYKIKKLYIMRHAKSSWKDSSLDDFDRPLSKRGKLNAPMMGKKLKKMQMLPDIILSSPAVRAKTTVELVAKELQYSKKILFKQEMYESSAQTLHKILTDLDNKNSVVLLCGHNPDINMLVQSYVDFNENIVTAGVVELEFSCDKWKDIDKSNAKFLSFHYPKMKQ